MGDLEWTEVESSHILTIAHNKDTLYVRFKGSKTGNPVYQYPGVSSEDFEALKNAGSKGIHLRGMGIKGTRIG